jgi:hypothetical protein
VIWIAWRFQRFVACALALLALIFVALTVVVGVLQHHDLVAVIHVTCRSGVYTTSGRAPKCVSTLLKLQHISIYDPYIRIAGFVLAPLVGAILGLLALTSEIDNRTVRLAWTQSISRTRWFVAKAGVGAAIVSIILVPTAITLSWWNGTTGNFDRFTTANFEIAGWDLVAYGLFMFALTMLAGAVIRRTGWALAVSVLLFLAVAATFPSHVRQHLAPSTVTWGQPNMGVIENSYGSYTQGFPATAWLLVQGLAPRSTSGTPTWAEVDSAQAPVYACESRYPHATNKETQAAERVCQKKYDVEYVAVYIDNDQFWTMQLREGLIYLLAGGVMVGGALSIVRKIEP